MKKTISTALFLVLLGALNTEAAVYIKIPDIEGESTTSSSQTGTTIEAEIKLRGDGTIDDTQPARTTTSDSSEQKSQFELQKASDDGEEKKGNVEYNWKVEEGEKLEGTGIEPDEIDVAIDGKALITNFGILLGGGGDDDGEEGSGFSGGVRVATGDVNGISEEKRAEIADVLLKSMQEEDVVPTESLSLNFGKIETRVRQNVRMFGFIPTKAKASVEIDSQGEAKVKFPWWAVFATGKDKDNLGKEVVSAIGRALEAKHDTVKNIINNVR